MQNESIMRKRGESEKCSLKSRQAEETAVQIEKTQTDREREKKKKTR